MKKKTIERTVTIDTIEFDDGTTIDSSVIKKFLDEAYEFVDTINHDENGSEEYIYFVTKDEKILEPILLKHDVIRLSPRYEFYNKKVGIEKYYTEYRYWLSTGYHYFVTKFEELYYN